MSGVVLRCPNCGTTRPSAGECDACHEAAVRLFCTNHTPGLWLEGKQCATCGARWGDPPRPAPAPPPPAATRRPAVAARPAAPPSPPADDDVMDIDRERDVLAARFREILDTAARAHHERAAPPPLATAPVVRGVGGCLVRLLVFLAVLFFGLVSAAFLFGGALLQLL